MTPEQLDGLKKRYTATENLPSKEGWYWREIVASDERYLVNVRSRNGVLWARFENAWVWPVVQSCVRGTWTGPIELTDVLELVREVKYLRTLVLSALDALDNGSRMKLYVGVGY